MIELFPLEHHLDALTPFWESIAAYYVLKECDFNYIPTLQERARESTTDKVRGLIAYSNRQPVALGWVERTTSCSGNVMVHTLHPEFHSIMPTELVKRGFLDGIFCELFQFEDTSAYRDAFIAAGAHENRRQRMGVYLSNVTPTGLTIPGVSFEPVTLDDAPEVAKLSAAAHRISGDYVGYAALEDDQGRLELEQRIFSGFYGPIAVDSAIKLIYQGQMVGICSAIEIACWGHDKVPWVFDICIHPEFMGRGFGRVLMEELLRRFKQHYEVCGLAVTLSNTSAVALYEKLGFIVTDPFFEYVVFPKGSPHGPQN